MRILLNTLLVLLLLTAPVAAQDHPILNGKLLLPASELAAQNSYNLLVQLDIAETWHINSNAPLEDFLIGTEITFDPIPGVSFGRVQYQPAEVLKFQFSETKMAVFEGRVFAMTTLTIQPDISADSLHISAGVYFQACNDESCQAPDEITLTTTVPVLAAGAAVTEANKEVFDAVLPTFVEEQPAQVKEESELSKVIRESGMVYAFIFIFLGGLALNLTPCVYPLIPITISYFGGQAEGKKGGLVMRAVVYVLGMAITYSVLGVLAALTGGFLGSALQNPIVLIFVAAVLIGLSLSMFGVYEIRVPQSLAMMGGKNRNGYFGTLFMGLTVGLIAAPCIGPFVLGLLTYVGDIGDPVIGFWMFFVLAMGLGTPFLVLGIFSGAMSNLPRSGAWMVWVRNIFGFILVGMAIYFLEPLFPSKDIYFWSLAIVAVVGGVYLGWIDKNTGSATFKVMRQLIGVLFIALGVFLAWPAEAAHETGIDWQKYSSTAMSEAQAVSQPVIIDFYADWCIPCKELDKFTFTDPRVIAKAAKFKTLKADMTSFEAELTRELRAKYDIKGVPTIIFLDGAGNEIPDLRLIGFEEAEQFLERMSQVIPGE
jgi:thiol:disulfide interchange protein DsbD